ncbi:OmpA family protein [Cloacibacterium sp. Arc13]|uniref:OmpA family protein n=1 Tax=unclassified Cloacibacterium TaxID=2620870 RepID=UPI00352C6203
MKNLKLGISALALTLASTAFAQTTSNPWVIGVGAHGVNHMGVANGGVGKVFDNFDQVFTLNNYTITPPLSKLTVARNLNKYFVLDWQTSVGNVDNKRFAMGKEFFLQTGLGLQFKFASLWNEESWFDPYARVGANYLRHDYSGLTFPSYDYANDVLRGTYNSDDVTGKANHFSAAAGLGANLWLTKNFGFNLQGDYVSTPGNNSNVADFWQASASLMFRFGNTDKDKDGIKDKDDACPDVPGLAQFQGCPDTDGDGVADKDDNCPEVAGPVENNGCPWPDTDGDGVLDKDDACPSVAGPAANNGCPWPDTDGDGILDKDDACPTVAGLAQYNGCPKTDKIVADEVTKALNDILFDFNKATIRPESKEKLDQAAAYIKDFPSGKFLIEGRTDKKGSDAYNLKLSRQRAASVVAALEARGAAPEQLKSRGVGEAKATVAETASDAERLTDRRVVVEAISAADWDAIQKSDVPAPKKSKK